MATHSLAAPGMVRAEEEVRRSVGAGALSAMEVENVNGNVTLTGVQGSDSIHVTATKHVCGRTEESANEMLPMLGVQFEIDGDVIRVAPTVPEEWRDNYGVSFEIRVPARFGVKTTTVNGSTRMSSVASGEIRTSNGNVHGESLGAVRVWTENGSVDVESASGPIDLRTVNGSVRLRLAGLTDSTRIATENGGVVIEMPEDTGAEISASCLSGRVHAEGLRIAGTTTPTTIRGTLGQGGPLLNVRTISGSIRIQTYR